MPSWDPAQYAKFGDHRLRPALDLIARIPDAAPKRLVDLGCGTGEITEMLAARWAQAEATGLDSSPDMLEKARALGGRPRFVEAYRDGLRKAYPREADDTTLFPFRRLFLLAEC